MLLGSQMSLWQLSIIKEEVRKLPIKLSSSWDNADIEFVVMVFGGGCVQSPSTVNPNQCYDMLSCGFGNSWHVFAFSVSYFLLGWRFTWSARSLSNFLAFPAGKLAILSHLPQTGDKWYQAQPKPLLLLQDLVFSVKLQL